MTESDQLIYGLATASNAALARYATDTLAPKIRQWEIVDAAARRLVTAQDNVVRSWLPSEADCAELDAAWADLRVALGIASDPEAA